MEPVLLAPVLASDPEISSLISEPGLCGAGGSFPGGAAARPTHGDESEHIYETVEWTRRPAPGEEPGCWPGRPPLLPRSTSSQSGLWCGCHGDGCFLAGGAVLLRCFRDTQTVEMLMEGVERLSCLRGADVY